MPSKTNLKLASFDGGGIRGLSQLEIMDHIMHRLAWDDESNESDGRSLPCEHFDLIGGSGTGGMIALLFAKLRMSVQEASEELWNVIEHVYNPGNLSALQRTEALKRCIEGAMKKKGLPIDLRLTTNKPEGCASFVTASPLLNPKSTVCLRTYPIRHQPTSSITVVEAVLATCATQPEFAPVVFGAGYKARQYIAASGAANPVHEVIMEAYQLFGGDASIASLLSLGSGYPKTLSLPQSGDESASHKIMWSMMHNCDQRAQEIDQRIGRVGIYSRFSVDQGLQNNCIDDPGWIAAQTEDYLGRHETGEKLDHLAKNFTVEKGPITLDQLKHAGGPSTPGQVAATIQKALDILLSDQDNELIAKLKPKDLEFESQVGTCLEGTRQGIRKRFREWVTDLEAPNILWINGYPGVGKSAIASTIVEELRSSNRLGSSFFFQRERASAMSPNALWCKVAYDLGRRYPSIRKYIVTALETNESLPTSPNVDVLFRGLIYEPLTKSDDIPTEKLPVIVLDALDECGGIDGWRSDNRTDLIKTLKIWSSLPCSFKLVVTSRWERDIERLFSTTSHCSIEIPSGEKTDSHSSADIQTFLIHELRQLLDQYPSLPTDWPGEGDILRLIDGARGIFIWIKTVIELLKSGEPRRTLRQILSSGAGSMNGLYSWILHAAFPKPSCDDKKEFCAVLGAIILTREPLDAASLGHFLSIDGSSMEYIYNGLKSVLEYGGIIRIRHQSFVDFLLDSRDCPQSFLINKERESRNLTLCCLKTMKNYLRFNICNLESSYVRNQDVPNLAQRVDECIPPYLSYSSRYWASHLAETEFDREMNDSLQYFMGRQFLWWLEVMSLIQQINVTSNMLQALVSWLRKSDQDDLFARDMQKFLAAFASVISQSAPHIYISALPFAPQSLGVSQHYLKHYPRTLVVKKGWNNSWPALQAIFIGHRNAITSVAFSPDGRQIVSGSLDYTIRVWDAETGERVLGPLPGHSGTVTSVSFSLDGRRIVSGSSDVTIRVWDAKTGEILVGPLEGHNAAVTSVSFSPNGRHLVSGSRDRTVRVWDIETGETIIGPLKGHSKWVNSVSFSLDGKRIVSGSDDCTIRVWNAKTGGRVVGPLRGHNAAVTSVSFSPDGRQIVSGSRDCTIRVWDTETGGMLIGPLQGHDSWVNSVSFSPNGRRIVSGSKDRTIRVWDAGTSEMVLGPLQGHSDCINSISFALDGRRIISGSSDCTIGVWDVETRDMVVSPLQGHSDSVRSVSFSSDGRRIVSGSRDRTVRVWDADTGEPVLGPLQGHSNWVNSVSFSLNGRRVVSGSDDCTIRVWNSQTGETVVGPLQGHSAAVTSVSFSPDGRQLVSGSRDRTVRVWDAETGEMVVGPLQGHDSWVNSVSFSRDGRRIISGSNDYTTRLWDAKTGETVVVPLQGHTNRVNSVSFSLDGKQIFSSSDGRTIQVWDIKTRETIVIQLQGHGNLLSSVSFPSDGTRIVSGSDDRMIQTWNAYTSETNMGSLPGYRCLASSFSPDERRIAFGSDDCTVRVWDVGADEMDLSLLQGHIDSVNSESFSLDGRRVVSTSEDGTVRVYVWDAEKKIKKMILGLLRGHSGCVNSVSFSLDGSRVVSGSNDCTIRVWNAETGESVLGPLHGHNAAVTSVSFSLDGTRIVSGSRDRKVRVWDPSTGKAVLDPLQGHGDCVNSVSFSPDGGRIVSASDDCTILVWNAKTGERVVGPLQGHSAAVTSVSFSPDGRKIVSGSKDCTVRVWDTQKGRTIVGPLLGHDKWVNSVAFSPDGKRIVSSSSDCTIWVWDVETGETVVGPLQGHSNCVDSVSFSRDGRRVLSTSDDSTIRVWDIKTRETIVGQLQGHSSSVRCASLSSDGTRIVSCVDDRTIQMRDSYASETGVGPLQGYRGPALSLSFSPDEKRIASGSDDCAIRVWNAETSEKVVGPLQGHDSWVNSVSFSPDGRRIVSGSDDCTIRLWDSSPKKCSTPLYGTFHKSAETEDGWMRGPNSELLFWVPPDIRRRLCPLSNAFVIDKRQVWTNLDLEHFAHGQEWSHCKDRRLINN